MDSPEVVNFVIRSMDFYFHKQLKSMFVLISIVHDYRAVGYMFIVSVGLFRQPGQ